MTLTKCQDSEGRQVVLFGSEETNPLCWKITNTEQGNLETSNFDPSLTDLFKKMGGLGNQNGNAQGNSAGKAMCVKNTKGWTLTQPSGKEYLGYCDNADPVKDSKEVSFLEIQKSDTQIKEIKVCSQNCFSDGEESGIQQLQTVSADKGIKVEFYKK